MQKAPRGAEDLHSRAGRLARRRREAALHRGAGVR